MKLFGVLGVWELAAIVVVALLIFGPKNLPKLGSALGKSVKNLRDGMGAAKKEKAEAEAEAAAAEELPEETVVEEVEAEVADDAPKKKVVKKVVKKAE